MTEEQILTGIAEILARHFRIDPRSVGRETSAYDVDGWDSVSHVYVMLDVESRFGVKAPADRVFSLENVGDLADLVAELSKGG
jgi:acyl carrier protein